MDTDGPSGFRNAPVTKFIVPIVSGCSALAVLYNAKPHLATQLSHFTAHNQFWRLFTSHWAFSSIGTTVVGTWLIYRMKIVERRYGSSKYAAFVFISFIASTLFQTGALITGSSFIKSLSSGPFAILFSMLYQFQKIVPASYSVNMLGFSVTDKTYVYIAAAQLLFSNYTSSIVPCLCGLAAGALYDQTNLKQWRFPKFTRSFTSKYILPILATSSKTKRVRTTRNIATDSTASSSRAPPSPPLDEQDIDTMFSMFPNYSRQDIQTALIKSRSDLNRAAEILLSTEPSTGSSSNSSSQ